MHMGKKHHTKKRRVFSWRIWMLDLLALVLVWIHLLVWWELLLVWIWMLDGIVRS